VVKARDTVEDLLKKAGVMKEEPDEEFFWSIFSFFSILDSH
jgi:hypothetical protein